MKYFIWSLQLNIGVFEANPSTTEGVRLIMDHLHQFVPWHGDEKTGSPHIIPCHGDQLSCERMWEAKRTRAFNENRQERLLGLEPTPQEFHHRGIILQVRGKHLKTKLDIINYPHFSTCFWKFCSKEINLNFNWDQVTVVKLKY